MRMYGGRVCGDLLLKLRQKSKCDQGHPPPSPHLLPPPPTRGRGVGAVLAGVALTRGERGRCRGTPVEAGAHGRRRWVVTRC